MLSTSLLKSRRHLATLEAKACIPQFETSEIILQRCPIGAWSTPLIDVFVLLKSVVGFRSTRILELGSYRGDTARLMAENTADEVRIFAVDVHPDHGISYRDSHVARRIERRVGNIAPALFAAGEKFDFIFVDANHDYASVMNDTAVAFDHLTDDGVIFWHDYHFNSYFHGMAGVPDALRHYAGGHAILSIDGTTLAMFSRHPGWETARLLQLKPADGKLAEDVWTQTQLRG
jgi:predicted O-methyltransferase YrrM